MSSPARRSASQISALDRREHKYIRETFAELGYVVVKKLIARVHVREMRRLVSQALVPLTGPAEFEAEVGYPGAPSSMYVEGGESPRRLLHAYSRNDAFARTATASQIHKILFELMATPDILLSQNHHNCIMTKYPGYSSETNWHQDIRYWSFDRPELVSIWCALGDESQDNGALAVIPGSHKLVVARGRLDRDLFLRPDLKVNRDLIATQTQVELEPGDVLFFHCRLFHSAAKNLTDDIKLSLVFTYHTFDNLPIPGTRSSRYPAIHLTESV